MSIDAISTANPLQIKRRRTEYKYSSLKEILGQSFPSKTKCNVFGVVVSFKETTKVKSGNDYFSILEIIDNSTDRILKIRLFHAEEEFFPKVCSGDVVRFHRLVPSTVDVNGVLTSSRGWSWVKWSCVPRDVLDRMEASSPNATITSADKATVSKLRNWFREKGMPTLYKPQAKQQGNTGQKKLADVKHNNFFNLTCEVLAVKIMHESCTLLRVWDGTKPKHPLQKSESFTAEETKEIRKDIPEEYMVDVSVYDDHVSTMNVLKVERGTYLKFTNLHAWPRQRDPGKECCELVLHSGNLFGRAVSLATNEEDLKALKCDLENAESLFCGANNQSSAAKSRQPSTSTSEQDHRSLFEDLPDTLSMLENLEESQSLQLMEESQSIPEEDLGDKTILNEGSNENTGIEKSQSDSCGSQSENLRCLHDSATVIDGDGPLKLTELSDVAKSTVSVNSSKMFRVRIRIKSCLTAPEHYVCHICPPTGMRIPAVSNDGEPLVLAKRSHTFVNAWRQVRGFSNSVEGSDVVPASQEAADEDVQSSQWFMPVGEEAKPLAPLTIETYHNAADGSRWESMKRSGHVSRKRKIGNKKFTMLYLSSDLDVNTRFLIFDRKIIFVPKHFLKSITLFKGKTDLSARKLKENRSYFDRVIRPIPLSILTSSSLPAVALQDGVFYYSSPSFAGKPSVPLLKDEALEFCENRVGMAMGSPVMVPQFFLDFEIRDDGLTEMTVNLSGIHAIKFFRGLTPQEYLRNRDEYEMDVAQCISRLIEDASWIECIIKKSSRASISDVTGIIPVYKIINTRLKEDASVHKF